MQTHDVEYRDETVNLRGLFFDHQSGSRWFDDAHRALQRPSRSPRTGVDAKPFR